MYGNFELLHFDIFPLLMQKATDKINRKLARIKCIIIGYLAKIRAISCQFLAVFKT